MDLLTSLFLSMYILFIKLGNFSAIVFLVSLNIFLEPHCLCLFSLELPGHKCYMFCNSHTGLWDSVH